MSLAESIRRAPRPARRVAGASVAVAAAPFPHTAPPPWVYHVELEIELLSARLSTAVRQLARALAKAGRRLVPRGARRDRDAT